MCWNCKIMRIKQRKKALQQLELCNLVHRLNESRSPSQVAPSFALFWGRHASLEPATDARPYALAHEYPTAATPIFGAVIQHVIVFPNVLDPGKFLVPPHRHSSKPYFFSKLLANLQVWQREFEGVPWRSHAKKEEMRGRKQDLLATSVRMELTYARRETSNSGVEYRATEERRRSAVGLPSRSGSPQHSGEREERRVGFNGPGWNVRRENTQSGLTHQNNA